MTTTPVPVPVAISRYVGYAWRVPAQMTDLDGAPLDISGWTIGGQATTTAVTLHLSAGESD